MNKKSPVDQARDLRLRAIERYRLALESSHLPTIERIETVSAANEFNHPFENFYPNQLWGHSAIIREEYGLEGYPLNVVVSHAPWFTPIVWLKEFKFGAPIIVFSYYHALQVVLGAQKLGVNCPSLLLHSLPYQIVQRKRRDLRLAQASSGSKKSGCVYFPIHSTTRWKKSFIHSDDDISRFSWLRARYGRLSLCLYYSDYLELLKSKMLDDYVSPFDELYCCGHRADPAFLPRLESILSRYFAVFSDEWSSVLFYGASSCEEVLVKEYQGFQFRITVKAHADEESDSIEIAENANKRLRRLTSPVSNDRVDIRLVDRHRLSGLFLPDLSDFSSVRSVITEQMVRGDISLVNPYLVEAVIRVDDLAVFLSE